MSELTTVIKPNGKTIEVNEHMLKFIETDKNSHNYAHRLVGWTLEVKPKRTRQTKAEIDADNG